jgi:hypothetical protein
MILFFLRVSASRPGFFELMAIRDFGAFATSVYRALNQTAHLPTPFCMSAQHMPLPRRHRTGAERTRFQASTRLARIGLHTPNQKIGWALHHLASLRPPRTSPRSGFSHHSRKARWLMSQPRPCFHAFRVPRSISSRIYLPLKPSARFSSPAIFS